MFGTVYARPSPVQFQSPLTSLMGGIGAGQQMMARAQQLQQAKQMQPYMVQQAAAKVPAMQAQTAALQQKTMYPGIGLQGQSGDLEKLRLLVAKYGANSPEARAQAAILQGANQQAVKFSNLSPDTKARVYNQWQQHNIQRQQQGQSPIGLTDYAQGIGAITPSTSGLAQAVGQIGQPQAAAPAQAMGAPSQQQQATGTSAQSEQQAQQAKAPAIQVTQAAMNNASPDVVKAQAASFQKMSDNVAKESADAGKIQSRLDDARKLAQKVHLGPFGGIQGLTSSEYQELMTDVKAIQVRGLTNSKNVRTQREFDTYTNALINGHLYKPAFLHALDNLQKDLDLSKQKSKFLGQYRKKGGLSPVEFTNQWGDYIDHHGYDLGNDAQQQGLSSTTAPHQQQGQMVTMIAPSGKAISVDSGVAQKLTSQGWRAQ